MTKKIRLAFAGDRDISVWVLRYLLSERDIKPVALLINDSDQSSHTDELLSLCSFLTPESILNGSQFKSTEGIKFLSDLELDYILSIHFPFIFPKKLLELPRVGVLNLHPAYLPYNKGWHTPSWSILEETPAGATLHFMNTEIDSGDIVHQKKIDVQPSDTANSLYRKLKKLEFEVFKEIWPQIEQGDCPRYGQANDRGTIHFREELLDPLLQKIDLEQVVKTKDLLKKLRALTTNRIDEAAFFENNGRKYRIQVSITEESS
jgi:methionyl-tRNA formyltransferase